jgi:hypothetical protein
LINLRRRRPPGARPGRDLRGELALEAAGLQQALDLLVVEVQMAAGPFVLVRHAVHDDRLGAAGHCGLHRLEVAVAAERLAELEVVEVEALGVVQHAARLGVDRGDAPPTTDWMPVARRSALIVLPEPDGPTSPAAAASARARRAERQISRGVHCRLSSSISA